MFSRSMLALVLAASVCGQTQPAGSGAARPSPWPPPRDMIAALESREKQLENLRCEVVDHRSYTNEHGLWVGAADTVRYRLVRLGETMLLDLQQLDARGQAAARLRTVWDGSRGRSLWQTPGGPPRGLIADREDYNFGLRAYNGILGLKLWRRSGPAVTASQWLRELDESRRTRVTKSGGFIEIRDETEALTRIVHLDPQRGFMPVRCNSTYQADGTLRKEAVVALQDRQVEGLWLPMRVISEQETARGQEQRHVYEVVTLELGRVTRQDLEVVFPPGTQVTDAINRVAYRLGADGAREPLPYDPRVADLAATPPDEFAALPISRPAEYGYAGGWLLACLAVLAAYVAVEQYRWLRCAR